MHRKTAVDGKWKVTEHCTIEIHSIHIHPNRRGNNALDSVSTNWTATPADGRRLGSFLANCNGWPFPTEDTTSHVVYSCLSRSLTVKLSLDVVKLQSMSTAIEDQEIHLSQLYTLQI